MVGGLANLLRRRAPELMRHLSAVKGSVRLYPTRVRLHQPDRDGFFQQIALQDLSALAPLHDRVEQAFLVARFVDDPAWERYGLSRRERHDVFRRLARCHTDIRSASDVWRSMLYVAEILRADPAPEGAVIECGCFKGASSAALSIACAIAGRKLYVCDSFQGLPEPLPEDRFHTASMLRPITREYRPGEYSGGLHEVRDNIRRFGELSVCTLVPGWFEESLPALEQREPHLRFVFALLDVDLFTSTRDCLLYIWPRLREGGRLYTDDGGELDIAAMFFEREWWRRSFGENPPGLYGAGFGINFLQTRYSAVGLATKGEHLISDQLGAILYGS